MLGRMNAIIEIIETAQHKDTQGFVTHTGKALAVVRAYKEERHGSETWKNRAVFSTATCMFRFRMIPNVEVTPAMVVMFAGERYNIVSVQSIRGMYVEVLADKIMPSK